MAGIRRMLINNRGQSMVEFALILPVLLLLVLGIVEFGRVYNASLVVTAAAREGARSAAVGNNDSVVIDTVKNYITGDKSNVSVTLSTSVRVPGQPVTVTVSDKVQIITPFIQNIIPADQLSGDMFLVQGSAVMRVE